MVLFFPRNVLRHPLKINNILNFQRIWKDSSSPSAPLLAPFKSPSQHFGSGATNLFACLHLFHHHRPIFHRHHHHQPDVSRVGQLNWLPLSHFADPGPSCGCSRQAPQSSKTSASSCPRPAWSIHPSFSRLDVVHIISWMDPCIARVCVPHFSKTKKTKQKLDPVHPDPRFHWFVHSQEGWCTWF